MWECLMNCSLSCQIMKQYQKHSCVRLKPGMATDLMATSRHEQCYFSTTLTKFRLLSFYLFRPYICCTSKVTDVFIH